MKIRNQRFSLRSLMVAVAILAVVLAAVIGLQRRKERFERRFSAHIGQAGPRLIRSFDPFRPAFVTAKGRWHYEMAMKYAEAARRPWLPVEPDSPEPE